VSAVALGTVVLAGAASLGGCTGGDSSGDEAGADDDVRTVQPGAPGEAAASDHPRGTAVATTPRVRGG
jgi:hypothetical protein